MTLEDMRKDNEDVQSIKQIRVVIFRNRVIKITKSQYYQDTQVQKPVV